MRPVYERIERRDPSSGEGIVTITSDYEADAIHQAIVDAGPAQEGISYMQFNIKQGVRHSTALAYLKDVVDPQLRVHGIDGLRVADASIMPSVTTGNTNAPSIMIGERCADFISGSTAGP